MPDAAIAMSTRAMVVNMLLACGEDQPEWLRGLTMSSPSLLGQIVVTENGTHTTHGELTEDFPLTAQLHVHDPGFYNSASRS